MPEPEKVEKVEPAEPEKKVQVEDEKPKVDLSDLDEGTGADDKLTADDVFTEEPVVTPEPEGDDKDATIKHLREKIEAQGRTEKETAKKLAAREAIETAVEKYPHADFELLKKGYKNGKAANQLLELAKATHFAVEKHVGGAVAEATRKAEAEAAERLGLPASKGVATTGGAEVKDLKKLDADEMVRSVQTKGLKRSGRGSL